MKVNFLPALTTADIAIIAGFTAVVIVIFFGSYAISSAKSKKCVNRFNAEDWDYILKKEKYMVRSLAKHGKQNTVYYMLFISAYEKRDNEKFVFYAEKIKDGDYANFALFYLAAHYLAKGNFSRYNYFYNALRKSKVKGDKGRLLLMTEMLKQLRDGKRTPSDPQFKEITSARMRKDFGLKEE